MHRFLFLAVLMLGTQCLWAQKMSQETSRGDIYIGYSLMNGDTLSKASGWEAALTGNFSDWFGLKVDLGGNYQSSGGVHSHEYNILFGPQISHHLDKVTLFGHGLLGVARFGTNVGPSDTSAAWVLGGGADYELDPRLAIRVGQFDYHGAKIFSATQKDFRYSAGLVFRFR